MFKLNTQEGEWRLQEAADSVATEMKLDQNWELHIKDAFDAAVEEAGAAITEGMGSGALISYLHILSQRTPFAAAEEAIENLIIKLET